MMRLVFIISLFFICSILRAEIPNIKPERHTSSASGQSTAAVAEADIQILAAMPLETLINKVKSTTDPKERAKVRMQIWESVPQNTKELNSLLDLADAEKTHEIQRDILRAVEDIKDVSFGPVFHKRIKKGNYNVRAMSIGKLAELKYKDAVPDLIRIVESFDPKKVREEDEAIASLEAFFALGEIGDDRAIPALLGKLGKLNGTEGQIVGKFGYKVLPQLIEIARTSKNTQERDEAYNAIAWIKDKKAIPLLWETLQQENKSDMRISCMESLLNVSDETTKPTKSEVLKYLYKGVDNDRKFMISTLFIAKNNGDIAYLLSTLQNATDHGIKVFAIDFLGDLKAQSAIPALEKALKLQDKETSMAAVDALKKITGKDYNWEPK